MTESDSQKWTELDRLERSLSTTPPSRDQSFQYTREAILTLARAVQTLKPCDEHSPTVSSQDRDGSLSEPPRGGGWFHQDEIEHPPEGQGFRPVSPEEWELMKRTRTLQQRLDKRPNGTGILHRLERELNKK